MKDSTWIEHYVRSKCCDAIVMGRKRKDVVEYTCSKCKQSVSPPLLPGQT